MLERAMLWWLIPMLILGVCVAALTWGLSDRAVGWRGLLLVGVLVPMTAVGSGIAVFTLDPIWQIGACVILFGSLKLLARRRPTGLRADRQGRL
jgi:hypothetical protein